MREYELEFEVSTETGEFNIKYWFTVSGKYVPAILYPNDQAQPEEFPEIEVSGIHLQITADEWLEVDNRVFHDWARDNEELFFEGIKDDG